MPAKNKCHLFLMFQIHSKPVPVCPTALSLKIVVCAQTLQPLIRLFAIFFLMISYKCNTVPSLLLLCCVVIQYMELLISRLHSLFKVSKIIILMLDNIKPMNHKFKFSAFDVSNVSVVYEYSHDSRYIMKLYLEFSVSVSI